MHLANAVAGSPGVGKSFIASALAQKACRDGYSALYLRAAALLRELALARADGSLRHLLARLGRIDVLVIDDWAMASLNEIERREVWEICEDRYQTRSTVLTSQLPVSRWHEQIGDPTIALELLLSEKVFLWNWTKLVLCYLKQGHHVPPEFSLAAAAKSAICSSGSAFTIFIVSRLTVMTWPTRRTMYSGSSARLGSLVMPVRVSVET